MFVYSSYITFATHPIIDLNSPIFATNSDNALNIAFLNSLVNPSFSIICHDSKITMLNYNLNIDIKIEISTGFLQFLMFDYFSSSQSVSSVFGANV